MHVDGLLAVGADGDEADGCSGALFDALEVGAGVGGEVVGGACAGDVLGEAGERFVDGRGAGEVGGIGEEAVDALIVEFVCDAEPEFGESGEDIEEHDGEGIGGVDHRAVAERNEVEPAASAWAARGGAVFASAFADGVRGVVVEFGREGTGADAGGVRLGDAEDVGDVLAGDARTGGDAQGGGGR